MDVFHAVVQMRPPIAREEEPPQAGWEPRSEPLLGCDQSFLTSGGFTQPRLNPLPATQSPQLNLVQKICPLLDRSPRMADTIDGTLSAGDRTGPPIPFDHEFHYARTVVDHYRGKTGDPRGPGTGEPTELLSAGTIRPSRSRTKPRSTTQRYLPSPAPWRLPRRAIAGTMERCRT